MQEREYRSVPFKDVDVKGRRFKGYAAVYDTTADLGTFTEEIRRGAFRKVLAGDPYVPMLFNHNGQLPPLASTRSGMTLKDDARGLLVEAELASHFAANAVIEGITRGDIVGMSFGFIAGDENSQIQMRDGRPHRSLLGFKLLTDVSPTHDPAYQETTAEIRSMMQSAVSLDQAQTDLVGEQPQNEEPVEPEEESAAGDTEGSTPDSGVEVADPLAAAAARSRDLEMLGIALPRLS